MNRLKAKGAGILMISSELPEILGMSDRVMIMRQGRIAGIYDTDNLTQEKIIDFVSWQLNVPSSIIFPSSNLSADLNLDPFDKMLLIAELESRLNVFLTSEEASNIETIQDVSQFFNKHAA